MRLLRGVAEALDDGRHEAHAEGNHDWRPGRRALLVEDVLLDRRPSRTAEFLRPAGGDPALLVEDAVPSKEVVARKPLAFVHLRGEVGGKVLRDEGAHLVAKGALVGAVFEIHDFPEGERARFRSAEINSARVCGTLASGDKLGCANRLEET